MPVNQAVILAGGLGTRLRPITDTIPKPMVPIHGKPFLEYLLELLKENGIKEVVLCLGYLPEKITEYFGDGSKFGIKITEASNAFIAINCGTIAIDQLHLVFKIFYQDCVAVIIHNS